MTGVYTCDPIRRRDEQCQTWLVADKYSLDDCDDGLHCVDGTCQCRTPSSDGVCLLAQGAPCTVRSGINQTSRCVPNSACATAPGSAFGVCKCLEEYGGNDGFCSKFLGFGEYCEDSGAAEQCNSALGLGCKSGTCQCELESSDSSHSCTIRVGRQCAADRVQCAKNAEYINDECKCKAGFEETNSGRECERIMYLGEDCKASGTTCHWESGLACTKGRCECRQKLSADKTFCILGVTHACIVNSTTAQCPGNSFCKTGGFSSPVKDSCHCHEGFIGSYEDYTCHKVSGKGDICSAGSFRYKHFCDERIGLDCIRNGSTSVCSCPYGESPDGKCRLQIGNKCEIAITYPSCPVNSKCEGHGDYKTCKCLENFIYGSGGLSCVPEKGYMQTCGEEIGACKEGLSCLRGVCQCGKPSDQVFDPEINRCKSKESCEYNYECASYSSCEPLYEGSRTKRCKCKEGYTSNSRSLCKANYLGTCSKRDDCLTAKSMDCIDGICRCSAISNQIYDEGQSACVGLVGSSCGTNNNKCISSAICGQGGRCICERGAYELGTGKCGEMLHFGANCTIAKGNESGRNCNWNKGLACINGVCACVDPNLEYMSTGGNQGSCFGKTGNLCELKIPVGNCAESQDKHGSGLMGFQNCNFYKILCADGATCKDVGNGVHRCRA